MLHGRNHWILRRHRALRRSPRSNPGRPCGSQPVLAEETPNHTSLVSLDDSHVGLVLSVTLPPVAGRAIHNLVCALARYWRDTGHATHCKSSNPTVPEELSIR